MSGRVTRGVYHALPEGLAPRRTASNSTLHSHAASDSSAAADMAPHTQRRTNRMATVAETDQVITPASSTSSTLILRQRTDHSDQQSSAQPTQQHTQQQHNQRSTSMDSSTNVASAAAADAAAPRTAKRLGRIAGSANWSTKHETAMLTFAAKMLPQGMDEWENVATCFNATLAAGESKRTAAQCKQKLRALAITKKPTGETQVKPTVAQAIAIMTDIDVKGASAASSFAPAELSSFAAQLQRPVADGAAADESSISSHDLTGDAALPRLPSLPLPAGFVRSLSPSLSPSPELPQSPSPPSASAAFASPPARSHGAAAAAAASPSSDVHIHPPSQRGVTGKRKEIGGMAQRAIDMIGKDSQQQSQFQQQLLIMMEHNQSSAQAAARRAERSDQQFQLMMMQQQQQTQAMQTQAQTQQAMLMALLSRILPAAPAPPAAAAAPPAQPPHSPPAQLSPLPSTP